MAVSIKRDNYPGLTHLTIDLGLGGEPVNTSQYGIEKALRSINGVKVENVGSLQAHLGVWGVNRRTGQGVGKFTSAEVAKIKTVAERIAQKG